MSHYLGGGLPGPWWPACLACLSVATGVSLNPGDYFALDCVFAGVFFCAPNCFCWCFFGVPLIVLCFFSFAWVFGPPGLSSRFAIFWPSLRGVWPGSNSRFPICGLPFARSLPGTTSLGRKCGLTDESGQRAAVSLQPQHRHLADSASLTTTSCSLPKLSVGIASTWLQQPGCHTPRHKTKRFASLRDKAYVAFPNMNR